LSEIENLLLIKSSVHSEQNAQSYLTKTFNKSNLIYFQTLLK